MPARLRSSRLVPRGSFDGISMSSASLPPHQEHGLKIQSQKLDMFTKTKCLEFSSRLDLYTVARACNYEASIRFYLPSVTKRCCKMIT